MMGEIRTMGNLFQLYSFYILCISVTLAVAIILIWFGYLMGRKTKTDTPMLAPRPFKFDPGPNNPEERSELDDAFYTADDREVDLG